MNLVSSALISTSTSTRTSTRTPANLQSTVPPAFGAASTPRAFQPTTPTAPPRLTGPLSLPLHQQGSLRGNGASPLTSLGASMPRAQSASEQAAGARRAPNLLTFETEKSVELAEAADKKKAPLSEGPRPNYLKFETVESMRRAQAAEGERAQGDTPGQRDLLRFEN